MADRLIVKLEGVDELRRVLADLPRRIREKAVRLALRKAGLVIRDAAKAAAPVLREPVPFRTRGLVRRKISVRPSKLARRAGDEGVFINVRPAKGASTRTVTDGAGGRKRISVASQRGARSPLDPFYWRFLEFGTKKMAARPFLGPAARNKGQEAVAVFLRETVPAIQRFNQTAGK